MVRRKGAWLQGAWLQTNDAEKATKSYITIHKEGGWREKRERESEGQKERERHRCCERAAGCVPTQLLYG